MLVRSPALTNRNADQRTPAALASFLPLLLKCRGFSAASVSELPGPECLQTVVRHSACPVSRDCADARSICGLQQEPIPAFGRFTKRILDVLLSSIAVLILWPVMLLIAVAV